MFAWKDRLTGTLKGSPCGAKERLLSAMRGFWKPPKSQRVVGDRRLKASNRQVPLPDQYLLSLQVGATTGSSKFNFMAPLSKAEKNLPDRIIPWQNCSGGSGESWKASAPNSNPSLNS